MAVATTSVARDTDAGARPGWETPSAAALTWLTVGTAFLALGGLLMLLTSAQQVSPGLLTTGPGTSVGRLRPVALTLLAYGGFGMIGTGLAMDVARRLAKAPTQLELVAKAGGALTTAAIGFGAISLVMGHSTGRFGFELSRLFSVPLALGLLLGAAVVLRTIAARDSDDAHPALWFLATGVVAGPVLLLVGTLPRVAGVNDSIVVAYASSGLGLLWLGSLAIGAALYVVPAACRAPLNSRALASVGYWGWLLFAPFAGPVRLLSGPAQDWLETIGVAASIALVVPLLAIAVLLFQTYARRTSLAHDPGLRFGLAGAGLMLVTAATFGLWASRTAAALLHLTVLAEGVAEMISVGIAGTLLAGAVYFLLPGLTGNRLANSGVGSRHLWMHVAGITLVLGSLLIAGFVQGALWTSAVRTGDATALTGAGWQVLTDLLRPLLWTRVIGEALLAAGWFCLFQQVMSTAAGDPLADSTGSGTRPAGA